MVIFASVIEFGVWRSWLAHLHGVQGVGCSSHLTPTKKGSCYKWLPFFYRLSSAIRLYYLDYYSQNGNVVHLFVVIVPITHPFIKGLFQFYPLLFYWQ